jgi:hypothetical protein
VLFDPLPVIEIHPVEKTVQVTKRANVYPGLTHAADVTALHILFLYSIGGKKVEATHI